jgi:hypothetical protein
MRKIVGFLHKNEIVKRNNAKNCFLKRNKIFEAKMNSFFFKGLAFVLLQSENNLEAKRSGKI